MMSKWTAALATVLLVCAAARAADDPRTGLAKCAALAGDRDRLACFDQLAAAVKASPEPPAAAVEQPSDDGSAWDPTAWFGRGHGNQTTVAKFGVDQVPAAPPRLTDAPRAAPLDSIAAKVVQYSYNPNGTFDAVLDNGQVWRQVQPGTARALFAGNDDVVISRGFMGSYNFVIEGSNTMFKVRRIK